MTKSLITHHSITKSPMNHIKYLQATIICICICISTLHAQQTPVSGLSNFRILVETTKEEIKLSCTEGCAFTQLSFTTNPYRPQAVDFHGMTDAKTSVATKHDGVVDFLFTIERNEDGVKLVGIRGTAWEELSFSCEKECKQWIDEYGMIEKD